MNSIDWLQWRKEWLIWQRVTRGLDCRRVGSLLGCSASKVSRINGGQEPDVLFFMAACYHMNVDPTRFFTTDDVRQMSFVSSVYGDNSNG